MSNLYKGRFGRWGQLGSAYNNSLTLMEKIDVLREMDNDLYENEVELNDSLDGLMKWVNEDGFPVFLDEKMSNMLANGELENLINEALFNTKADKTELAKQTVPLRKFYTDDFSTALNTAISQGYTEINIDGNYDVKTALTITNVDNIRLIGHAKLTLKNSITNLMKFTTCDNLSIDTITVNGVDFENYRTLWIDDCTNVAINHIHIHDIYNKNNAVGTYPVYMYAKNYQIKSATFERINAYIETADITTGRGAIQCIYVHVDSTHTIGYIGDVQARDIHNVDVNRLNILGDCDIIKTQRHSGETNEAVRSLLVINSVTGYNFGKRLVKLQAGGVQINNLTGFTEHSDGYAPIGIHAPNVLVNNLDINSVNNAMSSAIELGYLCDNITINNVISKGTFYGNFITMISQTFENVDRQARNVTINNIVLNDVSCTNFIALHSRISNFTINGVKGNVICTVDFIRHMRSQANNLELTLKGCDVNIEAPHFVNLKQYPMSYVGLDIIDSRLTYTQTGNESTRLFEITSNGDVTISNSDIILNGVVYEYGAIRLMDLTNFFLQNSTLSITSGLGLLDVTSNDIFVSSTNFGNTLNYLRPVNSAKIDNVVVNTIYLYKGGTVVPVVSANGVTGQLNVTTAGDVKVESTKVFTASASVTLASGVGVATINYSDRMTSFRLLNAYVVGRPRITIVPKNTGGYTSGTFDVYDSALTNDTVTVVVQYTY